MRFLFKCFWERGLIKRTRKILFESRRRQRRDAKTREKLFKI